MNGAAVEEKLFFAPAFCGCYASFRNGRLWLRFCGFDHVRWLFVVALEVWEKKATEIRKTLRRGYGESFAVMLERWSARLDGSSFFRPPEIPSDPEGVSAEDAMYLFESHGVLLACADGPRLTDYLQGKAILGLMQSMWKEDAHTCTFWAEELVVDGLVGYREAEGMFQRKLNGWLLWLCAAHEEQGGDRWILGS